MSHTWNASWDSQGNSYLIFSYALELPCGDKWIYHRSSYCGHYTVHNIITLPSPILSSSQNKCPYLMPSFLITKLVKFNTEFCSIDFEMHAFDFCILFLEQPINRLDFNKVCLGKYLWLSLLPRCSNLNNFIQSFCKNRFVFQTFSPLRSQWCKCKQCSVHLCVCVSQSLEAEFPINISEFQTKTGFHIKSSFLCSHESAVWAGCARARALH